MLSGFSSLSTHLPNQGVVTVCSDKRTTVKSEKVNILPRHWGCLSKCYLISHLIKLCFDSKLIPSNVIKQRSLNFIFFFYIRLGNFEESSDVDHISSSGIALPHAYMKSYYTNVK